MSVEQTTHLPSVTRNLSHALTIRNIYDLLIVIGLALILPGLVLLPMPLLRVPLGLVVVLFAPGYALTTVLFPRSTDLDGVARAALSFGLSVALIPMIALLLNALPWGIRPLPIALALSGWMVLLSSIGLWQRRGETLSEENYVPPIAHPFRWWYGLSHRAKMYYVIGSLVLTIIVAGAAFSVLTQDPTSRMTEFYVLGADGLAENYPREIIAGQEMQVQLGISNHERAMARYRIEVRAEGHLLSETSPITLEDGTAWDGSLHWTMVDAGDNQRFDILLFYNDDSKPYRQLTLWVNVRPKP